MSDVASIRLTWRLLRAVLPVFSVADTFPTTDDIALGGSGTLSEFDETQLGCVLTALRSEFEYLTTTQKNLDVGEFTSDGTKWAFLATSLTALLGDLEDLVHKDIIKSEKHVKLTMHPDHLESFKKLVVSWGALKYRHKTQADDSVSKDIAGDKSNAANLANPGSARIEPIPIADWKLETLTDDMAFGDIEVIEHAHIFASACTSLFTKMSDNPACGNPHRAKLCLSGFKQDRLLMDIETCKEADWISAVFTSERSDVLRVAFNSEIMWVDDAGGEIELPRIAEREESLNYHLTNERHLALKYRRLASVFLAASVFQLINSPWIEQHLDLEHIFLTPPSDKHVEQWFPRIHCALASKDDRRLQSESIAALGVLVMELKANRCASWTFQEDNDLSRDEPSFSHRLADGFGKLLPLFGDMFGPGRSLAPPVSKPSAVAERPILFDDEDATPSQKERDESKEFLNRLSPLFRYIKGLRKSHIAQKHHPRIRIAVLDFGVDMGIQLISQAIKTHHINGSKSKSFVGPEGSWQQDSHGHGSHMAQPLIKTAPTAEIYILKICTGKTVEPGYMKGIAEAIDWATDVCDADILSMSFAYQEDDALIDAALGTAICRNKLISAAASNNGGLEPRARPARREGVICIHATDALGNKGRINPSPLDRADNFATLGVAVPLRWAGTDIYKSGTSYAKGGVYVSLGHSLGGQGSILAKVLSSGFGGDASLKGERQTHVVWKLEALETTYFFPQPSYYRKCLQLEDVDAFQELGDHKDPVYLITGLKTACGATMTMKRGRQVESNAEASVETPAGPVDLQVGVKASASSEAELKIYHKRAFFGGPSTLKTKTVLKGAVLADDEPEVKDDDADEDNYEIYDLDDEDMEGLTVVKDEDEDEAWVLPSQQA
ncbi:hypothetical protein FGADI_12772 [Fusarium gaditjirri]|uniref:Peptidase S8/S53 domain-containing protein n=1 Tax=Fusarium gaditjirri TaxID=282569 RepID=A0A8H4SRG6_9HYPO|nr:hypothetical protein FGADI_12772 [Fusarium gaditjirri]